MSVRIAVSLGDHNGVGPEVILKGLQLIEPKNVTPIILGSKKVLDYYASRIGLPLPYRCIEQSKEIEDGKISLIDSARDHNPDIHPGQLSKEAGKSAMEAVEKGIELCMSGEADALVTAPVSKEAVQKAGYAIPGHTEFLALHTGTVDYMMMMVHDRLRVGLVTTHIPLRDVASKISEQQIIHSAQIMERSLKKDFGIFAPAIAVLGLNPHAGDGGHIGTEEIERINPALDSLKSNGLNVAGPFPADGFFGNRTYKNFDGILAMYHDQGLTPFKTISFGSGVNFTAGLPFIRTSPDHGTAFDIAGKGVAEPASFLKAFELAVELTRKRDREIA